MPQESVFERSTFACVLPPKRILPAGPQPRVDRELLKNGDFGWT